MTPQPLTAREFVRLSAVLGPTRAWECVRDDLRPDLALVRVYAIQQANPYGDVRQWKELADVAEWSATQLDKPSDLRPETTPAVTVTGPYRAVPVRDLDASRNALEKAGAAIDRTLFLLVRDGRLDCVGDCAVTDALHQSLSTIVALTGKPWRNGK